MNRSFAHRITRLEWQARARDRATRVEVHAACCGYVVML